MNIGAQDEDVSPGEKTHRGIRGGVGSPHSRVAGIQPELASATGISQATLSAFENDRVRLGVERAKVLGRALRCHPAVLVFPGWEVARESAA